MTFAERSMRQVACALYALIVGLGLQASLPAQEAGVAAASGLHLELIGSDDQGAVRHDHRHARLVALSVGATERPSPILAAGAFTAVWRGRLRVSDRDRYRFGFEGVGHFRLEIDGEPLLQAQSAHGELVVGDAHRLRSGEHELIATYTSLGAHHAARVRLSWEGRRFAREPVPSTAFTHDPNQSELRAAALWRRGRAMVADRNCLQCHDDPHLRDPLAMPELQKRGPELGQVGDRLERDWMESWLRDPKAQRADARMPRMLHGTPEEIGRDAVDLAAYLATLRSGVVDAVAEQVEDGEAERGATLFAELACIGCHQIGDEAGGGGAENLRPIDLRSAALKFRRGALASYLVDPRRADPWSRMPDLGLSAEEGVHLEAYLRSIAPAPDPVAAENPGAEGEADALRGRRRFDALGCASCHSGVTPTKTTAGAAKVDGPPSLQRAFTAPRAGCLAGDVPGGLPDFGFAQDELDALRAFARIAAAAPETEAVAALDRGPADEFVARQFLEQRCVACHALDGRLDDASRRAALAPLGLEHEVQQLRPGLSAAGDKLRPRWVEAFLSGRVDPRPRPWLGARMPTYPQIADGVGIGLAAMHGHPPRLPMEAAVDGPLSKLGQALVGLQGGFGCVTCHALGDADPVAVFEVRGTNLALAAERLRPEFYSRWMWDPLRLHPAARMPKYADRQGRTGLTDLLDGDARAQFGAIWEFLRSLR